MIAYLKASREQIWMAEEWHGRTHLCFLISEGLCGHFGPFLWGHDETPLRASAENGQGKSQMRITQRQGDVNRHIMIADGPRTLSPSPSQPYTCPSCTILENIIRGKTERRKLYLCVFCKQCSLFYTSGSPFFFLLNLSFTSWRGGAGGGGELPLWDAKVLPVHCAAGCQVKLGSTGSVSVKKSILDGRLLPGKSVLIPGLILDQRLQQNDMPLAWKWTHSAVEIGWKCVRWLPRFVVLTLWARGDWRCGCREWGLHFQNSSAALGVFSRPLLSGSCKCLPPTTCLLSPVFSIKHKNLKIKHLYSTVRKGKVRCIIDEGIMCLSWRMTFSCLKT